MPLITLDAVSAAFGHVPLLDRVAVQIDPGERVALIGRNGTGKSTLLRILSGDLAPDAGAIWREPGLTTARLAQEASGAITGSVFEAVASGLGDLQALLTAYHRAAHDVADRGTPEALNTLGRLQHDLDAAGAWTIEQRIELVIDRLGLPADAPLETLSGGWRRRVFLARALVSQPRLLLLDEPTNHLDIAAIEWLETFLADYAGAVVFVTHDREFLERLATRVIELDRGRLTSWPGDYATFVRKKEAWLEHEALANEKFDKRLAQEETWLRRGVKARRTRDEGRVRALMAMRAERAARRVEPGRVHLQVGVAERSGQMVFEAEDVTKRYGDRTVIRDFSLRVMRRDRMGLIGPNGAGKTTLLRLVMGTIPPDEGEIRQGANVEIVYFDQQRDTLDPERTVADTVGDGNDTVTVAGATRHIYGYLEDFLFPPERARSPVKALSGGERSRLLLARLFTRPANVLIMDEPTNDLDVDTLELLEARLVDFPGTLLLVSHDRRFLNNVVTSTLVFEGDGRVQEYVGGYDEARAGAGERAREDGPAAVQRPRASEPAPRRTTTPAARLSYRERLEFEALPARLEALESEHTRIEAAIGAAEFYRESSSAIAATLERLEAVRREIDAAYQRWDELDSRTR